jgi:hypothetical protein
MGSDDEEIAKELLPSVVLDALNHHTQYLKSLHISHSQLFGQPFNPHHRRTAPGMPPATSVCGLKLLAHVELPVYEA